MRFLAAAPVLLCDSDNAKRRRTEINPSMSREDAAESQSTCTNNRLNPYCTSLAVDAVISRRRRRPPSPVGLKLVSRPSFRRRFLPGKNGLGPTEKRKLDPTVIMGPPRLADKSHCVKVSFVVFFPQPLNVQTMTKRRFAFAPRAAVLIISKITRVSSRRSVPRIQRLASHPAVACRERRQLINERPKELNIEDKCRRNDQRTIFRPVLARSKINHEAILFRFDILVSRIIFFFVICNWGSLKNRARSACMVSSSGNKKGTAGLSLRIAFTPPFYDHSHSSSALLYPYPRCALRRRSCPPPPPFSADIVLEITTNGFTRAAGERGRRVKVIATHYRRRRIRCGADETPGLSRTSIARRSERVINDSRRRFTRDTRTAAITRFRGVRFTLSVKKKIKKK
ncbi:hypothetical protein PUN28_004610 [Cardiocondyla obscurior]|uniref:Ribosomal protein S11 n=1 Tax=Cardiocondyla obscurior TaxID=286306 RepID=A0AAW2GDK4_9HYME